MTREDIAFWYLEQLPYTPYPFQEEAVLAWFSSEQGLLACAPTGMGKTLIAEAGLYEALKTGKRAYYTTPLIALTEQKYREIREAAERWGFSRNDVGLVTGNRKENEQAPILVVVAEILFNRLLSTHGGTEETESEEGRLSFGDVSTVVMDEFHQFADPERGIVWEFTLELLPPHVRTLLISATVGNAYEFVAWLRDTTDRRLILVQSTERKVPLTYEWVGERLLTEQLEMMVEHALTPGLVFCFDRNECWSVADEIRGRRLVAPAAQKEIAARIDAFDWGEGAGPKLKQLLLRGIGLHHAGILPKYRRIVESLFQEKLLSYCVCTETLAAGINLPARSVVLPTIMKGPPGEKKILDASSAHQIFGRAGRPQYDTQGYVFALAHEDDVKIARWRIKYDQIPDDTKDPQLRTMKKKMKKNMPTRRATEQYWNEEQFLKLKEAPARSLSSFGHLPWRFLGHVLTIDPRIEPIRKLVARRLMGQKRLAAAQKELDLMLLTLHRHHFVRLQPADGADVEEWSEHLVSLAAETERAPVASSSTRLFSGTLKSTTSETSSAPQTPPAGRDIRDAVSAVPQPRLAELLKLRGINPLFGLFLVRQLDIADMAERVMALESLLELPGSIGSFVRIPKQRDLPPGPLQTQRLDRELLESGLASAEELIEKTEEEEEAERESRRRFGGYAEERVFVLTLPEKLGRLFAHRFPDVYVKIVPVWAVGEVLFEFKGDFNKYVTSKGLQKQEGIVFRHLLRMVLLIEEFKEMVEWSDELAELGRMLVECCRRVDPMSTEENVRRSRETG